MINRLRKKFIVAAIVAVFLVLALLIGAINVFNYRSLVSDADATLQILANNKGSFPRQMFREQNRPSGMQLPPDEGGGGPAFGRRGGIGELAYQSRFFTASFDEGGLSSLNLESLVSLTEEEAAALAQSVYASGRERGFSGEYRYRRASCDGEILLLFLNCERELSTFRGFL